MAFGGRSMRLRRPDTISVARPSERRKIENTLSYLYYQSRLSQQRAGPAWAICRHVHNHHERELSERLTSIQHAHHDLTISSMHAHLDHDQCIEPVYGRPVL
jgi:metal-responsive CopG/Arc/MetJ family transcriptional regulator